MAPFSVEVTAPGRLSIRGEIDGAATAALEAACAEAGDHVRIDCSGCGFLDSAGVSTLLRLRSGLVERGSLTLANPSPAVGRLLAVTGLGEAFGVVDE